MMIEDESRATDKVYLSSVLRVRTVNDHSSCATLKYSHNQHEDFFHFNVYILYIFALKPYIMKIK